MKKNYFADREFLKFPKKPTPQDLYLREAMRGNLNVVRANIKSPMRITNCVRVLSDFKRLIKKGYNPSSTSDHFWGKPIPTIKKKNISKYGKFFTFSAGAVDVQCPNVNLLAVFYRIKKLQAKGRVHFGQVIYEKSRRTEWIHLGNSRLLLFSRNLLMRVGAVKSVFLKSLNGGKSYIRA